MEDIDEIIRVCRLHGIDEVSDIKILTKGFANRNYKIRTRKGNFFYRVCKQQKNIKNIMYEVDILSEPLPIGLIHGDVFPDNTLFKNGRLSALID